MASSFSKTRPMYRSEPPRARLDTPRSQPVALPLRPRGGVSGNESLRRLNKCMFLEFDETENRWRDALHRTPAGPQALRPARTAARPKLASVPAANDSLPPLPIVPLWENPLVVGVLLALCPPVGVTLAWSARSIPQAGRVALTVFGALVMFTMAVVGCLVLM